MTRITIPLVATAVLAGLQIRSALATCYRPDGSKMDDAYMPCNGTAEVSMCCHLAFSNNGGDLCGSGSQYGLCGVTGTQLWRESCTDPTWKSPACLRLCIDGDKFGDDAEITQCSDGSYCCGSNNATCCSAGDGVWIVNNQVQVEPPGQSTTLSSSSSTTSATPTNTIAESETTSSTPTGTTEASPAGSTSSPNSGLSSGAAAGIGVGATVVVIALAAVIFMFLRRRRKVTPIPAVDSAPPVEMENTSPPVELANTLLPVEKPADEVHGHYPSQNKYQQPIQFNKPSANSTPSELP